LHEIINYLFFFRPQLHPRGEIDSVAKITATKNNNRIIRRSYGET